MENKETFVTIQPPMPTPEPAEQQEVINEIEMENHQFDENEDEDFPDDSLHLHSMTGSNYEDPKTAGFRRTRNYQTEQQSLFIGLLNMVYNITIDHPRKKSKITLPFFSITRISTDKEVIELKEIMSYQAMNQN